MPESAVCAGQRHRRSRTTPEAGERDAVRREARLDAGKRDAIRRDARQDIGERDASGATTGEEARGRAASGCDACGEYQWARRLRVDAR